MRDYTKKYPKVFRMSNADLNKGGIPDDMMALQTFLDLEPASTTGQGDPVVTMIWEAGQWYWNPFGM